MKKTLILLCLVLVTLISCSEKVFVCSDGSTVNDPSLCPKEEKEAPITTAEEKKEEIKVEEIAQITPVETKKPVQTEITDKQKKELDKILVNRKTAVYPSSLGVNEQLAIGDSYTFAFGIKNTEVKDTEFKFSIELLAAKSVSFSNMGADETVVSWIKSDAKTYLLKNKETAYIPIIVTVEDKMNREGKQTLPGVYTFRIITETVEGVFTRDYNTIEFSVRVK